MTCLETVQVGWRGGGGLVDMAVAPSFNQLVGASLSAATVTTYIADVKSCVPFTSPLVPSSPTCSSSPRNRRVAAGVNSDSSSGGIITPPQPSPSDEAS